MQEPESLYFGAIAALPHIAPLPRMVAAGIQKQPPALFAAALPQPAHFGGS